MPFVLPLPESLWLLKRLFVVFCTGQTLHLDTSALFSATLLGFCCCHVSPGQGTATAAF